jgi:hypothetical protein
MFRFASPDVRLLCGVGLVGLVVLVALAASGCSGGGGEETYPISGTVTYNGDPVANVSVVFNPSEGSGRPGSAITDAQGKFSSVTTYESGDGVIPGEHVVTLAAVAEASTEMVESADAYAPDAGGGDLPFPTKYLNTVDSDLKVSVTESGQVLDLQLSD